MSQKSARSGKARRDSSSAIPIPRLGFTMMAARLVFWGFAFLLMMTISATLGGVFALISPGSAPSAPPKRSQRYIGRQGFPQYKLSRPVNVLVMGIDGVPDAEEYSPDTFTGHSDTILLVRLDPTKNSISLLSIPRDTRIDIPGIDISKINDANPSGGPALASRVISSTLNDVPIDRYVRVSTGAFRELVDLLAGVEVFVPKAISYTDSSEELSVNLNSGWQTLNGEQAEQFARFRNDEYGDIGRIRRQHSLLKALQNRLSSPSVLPQLPGIVRVMQKYVDSNLSLEEMLVLVHFAVERSPADLKMVMLPGRFSNSREYKNSYWILDPVGRLRVMRDYFNQQGSYARYGKQESVAAGLSPTKLKIAIQNASGNPQLPTSLQKYLETKRFYNVYVVEDWPAPQRLTQIVVQKGDLKGAEVLKKILGVGRVEASSTGDLDSDLTIRLGEDWVNKQ